VTGSRCLLARRLREALRFSRSVAFYGEPPIFVYVSMRCLFDIFFESCRVNEDVEDN
jgi:hypothetical protein